MNTKALLIACFCIITGLVIVMMTKFSSTTDQSASLQTIQRGLSGTKIDKISSTPIIGLYQVTAGNNIFYSDKTGRYLLFGHLYDVAAQQNLTPTMKQEFAQPSSAGPVNKIDWSSLPQESAIITGKKGGIPVAIFIDPDCPYCRALQQELQKNISLEVHEYLLPLSQLHPEAPHDSQIIWCNADRADALFNVMAGRATDKPPACDLAPLMRIQSFADTHQFNGTPIMIRRDGAIHWGYFSLPELTAWAMAGEHAEKKNENS